MNGTSRVNNLSQFYKIILIINFFLVIFLSGCSQAQQSGQTEMPQNAVEVTENSNQSSFDVSASGINLSEPLKTSDKRADVALVKKIDEIIEQSEFKNARWGVFVISLKDGRVLVARDGRKLFIPASVLKTLPSIVALDKIGADFRWKTAVYANNQIADDGTLNSDLTLYGQGAPDFADDGLEKLVSQLQSKGLKRVKGNIVGDESYFRGDALGDGWTWNDLQWYYGAEASAMTYKQNEAAIYSQNGEVVASTEFVQVENDLARAENIQAVGIKRELGENKFYVWGNGENIGARVAVEKPALWSAQNLRSALIKKGIPVEGEAVSVDWKSKKKLNPENAVELAAVESQTLAEIVKKMNKKSINLYGELILRTIGKKLGETAPDEDLRVQKLRGDDSAGTSVLKKWLKENNVATEEIEIHDGSGLSRLNMVTPESFGRALVYAAQSNFAETFKDSLPIAGTDGTLSGRLSKVKGKILAKTGSISYVSSLAGYAQSDGETLAFVIICNNDTHKKDSSQIVDEIAASLVDFSSKIGAKGEKKGK